MSSSAVRDMPQRLHAARTGRTLALHMRAGEGLTWPSWVSCGSFFSSGDLLSLVPEEESWSSDTFTCLLASVWPAHVLAQSRAG